MEGDDEKRDGRIIFAPVTQGERVNVFFTFLPRELAKRRREEFSPQGQTTVFFPGENIKRVNQSSSERLRKRREKKY